MIASKETVRLPVAAESAARLLSLPSHQTCASHPGQQHKPNRPREAGSFCQLDQQPKLQQRNGDEQNQKSEKHAESVPRRMLMRAFRIAR